jgi:probable F420-dependent oxidoreductase
MPSGLHAAACQHRTVRFTYAEAMTDPSLYLPLAQAAEAAGFDGFLVPDSICYPAVSDARYPYTPDGDRTFLEDKAFLEPFSIIPAMGAVTERIRFVVSVLKLTVRHPVLVAKQAASTAFLTGDRLTLGVGTSPWPEDYEVCGVPFERRGQRADESIAILRGLLTGDWFEHHGEVYDVPRIKQCPAPATPLPILVGGHAAPALRRAATLGDGWIHGGGDAEELPGLIERVLALRREAGRGEDPFEIHVISTDAYTPQGIDRLEQLGVTDVIVGFRWPYVRDADTEPLAKKVDDLNRYAEDVIAPTR